MQDDLEYWGSQLNAYLEEHTETHLSATLDYNDNMVFLQTPEMDRDSRAELIHSLERHGFTVTTGTQSERVEIEASSDRLSVDYA